MNRAARCLIAFLALLFATSVATTDARAQQGESLNAAFAQYKTLRDTGRLAEAEPYAREALRLGEELYAPDDPQLAHLLGNLAELEDRLGRPAEAAAHYRQALEILEASDDPDAQLLAVTLGNLAELERTQDRLSEALPLAQRALEIFQSRSGPGASDLATAQLNLASIYMDLGRPDEAKPLLEQALLAREAERGRDDPLSIDIRRSLAAIEAGPTRRSTESIAMQRQLQGRYEDAEVLYRQALAEREATQGPEHPDLTPALRALAKLLMARAAYEESEALLRHALAILDAHPEARPQGRSLVVDTLARLLARTGRPAEAAALRALYP